MNLQTIIYYHVPFDQCFFLSYFDDLKTRLLSARDILSSVGESPNSQHWH